MLYEYYKIPWSQVVAEATEFNAVSEPRNGRAFTKVALRHPKANLNCVLFFDEKHRLVERQQFRKPSLKGSKPDPDLSRKQTFFAYQAHPHASGEVIWFPHEAVYRGYLGRARDGTLLNQSIREIKILDIKFNVDLPDSLFDLYIPKDAEVYDQVSELGWLDPGDRPAAVFPEEARKQRWLIAGVIAGVALLGLSAFILYRRRRARLA